jgi:hypothetical protein
MLYPCSGRFCRLASDHRSRRSRLTSTTSPPPQTAGLAGLASPSEGATALFSERDLFGLAPLPPKCSGHMEPRGIAGLAFYIPCACGARSRGVGLAGHAILRSRPRFEKSQYSKKKEWTASCTAKGEPRKDRTPGSNSVSRPLQSIVAPSSHATAAAAPPRQIHALVPLVPFTRLSHKHSPPLESRVASARR